MNEEQKREMIDGLLKRIEPTVEEMRPVLAGKEPVVQSAALAMCLVMWVKGHQVLGNPEATTELQDQVSKKQARRNNLYRNNLQTMTDIQLADLLQENAILKDRIEDLEKRLLELGAALLILVTVAREAGQ